MPKKLKYPLRSRFFFRLKGRWYFSPFQSDRNPKNWSHDREFPFKLSDVWREFRNGDSERLRLVAACADLEWQLEYVAYGGARAQALAILWRSLAQK